MKKEKFRIAMAHVAIVSSLTLAVLLVLGDINPRMGFMRCGLSLATAAVSICSAIYFGVGEIVRHARGAEGARNEEK
ncbi:MAG: hypothetical protein J6Y19_06765 [Kiritimatiellae bacterium]|nr:hypothetical protein [Kiritimatiellia bacterium]